MGSDGAAQDELRCSIVSSRKFKFPRKIFGDSNTVDPASVPRKLRSAIRKRSCESASAALSGAKRLNSSVNGFEPLRNDSMKKTKMSTNGCIDHSAKPVASVPISEDEVEVAETLFALAGMIPLSDLHGRNKMDHEPLESKALDLAERPENSMPLSRVPKEEQEINFYPASGEAAIVAPMENSSPGKSVQEESLTGPVPLSCPQLSERGPMNLNLKVSVPQVNLLAIPPLLRTCDQQPLINSTFSHTSTEPSAENSLNEIKQETALIPNSGSLVRTGAVDVESHLATLEERRHNGLASRSLHDSGVCGLHFQSSAIIFPSWLDTATSSSTLGTRKDLSTEKLSCSMNGTKESWTRCAAHVYISRLIRVLQLSEGKETQTLDARQLRPSQTLGGSHIMPDHSNIVSNRTNGTPSDSNMFTSVDHNNSHEGTNVIPVTHHHHQEQLEGPSFSGYCALKESFDFLSLSSSVTPAADNGANRSGDNMESGVKCPIRHLQSFVQRNRPMHFSSPQTYFTSRSCCDRVAPASVGRPRTPQQGNLQVPQYLGNPFMPAPTLNTTSVQQPQPKQQRQQQAWTAQLAAQFRPGPLLSSHIANWQNGWKDMQSSACTEALVPFSQPSPEVLQAKHHKVSQPSQLIALGQSLGPTRSNRHHIQLLSSREDSGNQLRPSGALPLQLTLQ